MLLYKTYEAMFVTAVVQARARALAYRRCRLVGSCHVLFHFADREGVPHSWPYHWLFAEHLNLSFFLKSGSGSDGAHPQANLRQPFANGCQVR